VRAAMPAYVPNQTSVATDRATRIANANQITSVNTSEPSANHFRVTVSATYPTFFGSLFGFGSKTMSAKATGMLNISASSPAIYAGGPGCTAQYSNPPPGSVMINGAGNLIVNGDIATASDKAEIASWGAACTSTPGLCKVTGNVKSPCAVYQDTSAPDLTVAGTSSVATPDPLNPVILGGACTVGTLGTPLPPLIWIWNAVGNCFTLAGASIYCSNAMIQLTPGGNGNICATGTFISTVGVTVQTDGTVNLTAAPAAPMAPNAANRLLIGTAGAGDGTCGNAAVWVTAGALVTTFTMNGSIYAPNGCVHVASDALTFNENGLIDGKMVLIEMGTGKTWQFNGPSGGVVSSAWSMAD